jgi:hypothetical protein
MTGNTGMHCEAERGPRDIANNFTSASIAVSAAAVCKRDIVTVTVKKYISCVNGRHLSSIRDSHRVVNKLDHTLP